MICTLPDFSEIRTMFMHSSSPFITTKSHEASWAKLMTGQTDRLSFIAKYVNAGPHVLN